MSDYQIRKKLEPVLMSSPGVVGVGGSGGVINIYVEGTPILPESIAGYKTKVITVGHIRALSGQLIDLLHSDSWSEQWEEDSGPEPSQTLVPVASGRTGRIRPCPGGMSCGSYRITAGTLGMAISLGGRLYGLSNNHVLAAGSSIQTPTGMIGDEILAPGRYDGGTIENDMIGRLIDFVPLDEVGENIVDVAIFEPTSPEDLSPEILEIGTPTGFRNPAEGMAIRKSGRTTGLSTGVINDIDVTIQVDYGHFTATFIHQVMMSYMMDGGDSGSMIVAQDGLDVVGLGFAGSEYVSIANPIQPVLDALSISPTPLSSSNTMWILAAGLGLGTVYYATRPKKKR